MIEINRYCLSNGLVLLHHENPHTPMVCVNLAYNVGAKDESPEHTGYAHLMEHLMFGGSDHVPDFDLALQPAGGYNNAWTDNDMTNFYDVLPAVNIETALWLESDRMKALTLSEKSFEVQQKVVMEEYRLRQFTQPYGDMSSVMRSMLYKNHPYRWSTIGLSIDHIGEATREQLRCFYKTYYAPNNAVLSIVGSIPFRETLRLVEKWFGDIEPTDLPIRQIQDEPEQKEPRRNEVVRDVPSSVLLRSYRMPGRPERDWVVCDVISDLLASGFSSRIQKEYVQTGKIRKGDAYVTQSIEDGYFTFSFMPSSKNGMNTCEQMIDGQIQRLKDEPVDDSELNKVRNIQEMMNVYGEMNYKEVASKLCCYELSGLGADYLNREVEAYCSVTKDDIRRVATQVFSPERSCTLLYRSKSDVGQDRGKE